MPDASYASREENYNTFHFFSSLFDGSAFELASESIPLSEWSARGVLSTRFLSGRPALSANSRRRSALNEVRRVRSGVLLKAAGRITRKVALPSLVPVHA